jgi:uncharacterized Ntn-hydrolase superfamily protein
MTPVSGREIWGRRGLVQGLLLLFFLGMVPGPLSATWSIVAVDRETGRIVIASATCVSQRALRGFPSQGLWDVQAIVVPGRGAAVAQAAVDRTGVTQRQIRDGIRDGQSPDQILRALQDADPSIASRQFGIVDLEGRSAGFSGARNGAASLALQGAVRGTGIEVSIQGNLLASDAVVLEAMAAFLATEGTLEDRVMAAMEAADRAGGDARCTCETAPVPDAPCTTRTAHVAYILAADPTDVADPDHHARGEWYLFLEATDEDIRSDEDANPVRTLRLRYDAWAASRDVSTDGSID